MSATVKHATGFVLLSLTLLPGCAPTGSQSPTPLDPDLVAISTPQGGGMDALLHGELAITDDCVYIRDPHAPGGRYLPVFPADIVAWDADALVIHGTPHRDGTLVEVGGGGYLESERGPYEPDADVHVPKGCATDAVWFVSPSAPTR